MCSVSVSVFVRRVALYRLPLLMMSLVVAVPLPKFLFVVYKIRACLFILSLSYSNENERAQRLSPRTGRPEKPMSRLWTSSPEQLQFRPTKFAWNSNKYVSAVCQEFNQKCNRKAVPTVLKGLKKSVVYLPLWIGMRFSLHGIRYLFKWFLDVSLCFSYTVTKRCRHLRPCIYMYVYICTFLTSIIDLDCTF